MERAWLPIAAVAACEIASQTRYYRGFMRENRGVSCGPINTITQENK
jgi:hypothetical protein